MNTYQGKILLVLFCCVGSALRAAPVWAEESPYSISVKPDRCIALRQGQKCYQKLTFRVLTSDSGHYCIQQQEMNSPLVCWHGQELKTFHYKFVSTSDAYYSIIDKTSGDALADTKVQVAWVYRNKKKEPSGWRLF